MKSTFSAVSFQNSNPGKIITRKVSYKSGAHIFLFFVYESLSRIPVTFCVLIENADGDFSPFNWLQTSLRYCLNMKPTVVLIQQ